MKLLIIECTAEEMRANRTIMDSVTDTLNIFANSFCKGVTANDIANCMCMEDNTEGESESDD